MKKAQSMIEYTVLMIIIIAALITLNTYMKRGFQGRWKQQLDDLGDQYDPQAMNGSLRYTLNSTAESMVSAVNATLANGDTGKITLREDTSTTVEKKEGYAQMAPGN